jgi:hypothetical protein
MRTRALAFIAGCADADKLEQMIERGEPEVERAAMLRLYEVKPAAKPGTLEHDVWRSIYALEAALSSERERTTRLGRTRPKIAKDGEAATVADLVMKKEASEGFRMLMERDMAQLTFEAVALRHPERFPEEVRAAAQARLQAAGANSSEFTREG